MARILGVDVGIASVGWALIDDAAQSIVAAGCWMFDAPERARDQAPLSGLRGGYRRARRTLRRRRQRMVAVRKVLSAHGLLADAGRDGLRPVPGDPSPWLLRAQALLVPLPPRHLALAMGHIARHRGFQSNSMAVRGRAAAEDHGRMRDAAEAAGDGLLGRTFGTMMVQDGAADGRMRNRAGDYRFTPQRADLLDEVRRILAAQRCLGSRCATPALEAGFLSAAFHQRPLRDDSLQVGPCPFEPGQRRTARAAPSFELFRVLARLNALQLVTDGVAHRLTPDQVGHAVSGFGHAPGLTYRAVRRQLGLGPGTRFAHAAGASEDQDVVVARGHAAAGTWALRTAVEAAGPAAWRSLAADAAALDRVAEVLSFRGDLAGMAEGLAAIGLPDPVRQALLDAARLGRFAGFKGAGHLSAKAARALLPSLLRGHGYPAACAAAGYDSAAGRGIDLAAATSPVTRKAVTETLKQVRAIARIHGMPDQVHVELARGLGRSPEERARITGGAKRRTEQLSRLAAELDRGVLGRPPRGQELRRFELWREQGGLCPYSGDPIPLAAVAGGDARFQVDHILPWSRFGDGSYANQALVSAKANADKQDLTPFEWFARDGRPGEWQAFCRRILACPGMKRHKQQAYYLRQGAPHLETRLLNRNLHDTRHIARLVLAALRALLPRLGQPRVFARPGALTAHLRQAWGLEALKKDESGRRLADDRHNALDAIVAAACTDAALHAIGRAATAPAGRWNGAPAVAEPWPGFAAQAAAASHAVFVARAERARVPGALHQATTRQVRVRDGRPVVYERKPIEALRERDLGSIKDLDRNAGLHAALLAWIRAGKPRDALPRSPQADPGGPPNPPIRKVRLATSARPAVMLARNGGSTAARGEMARVDVFYDGGRFRLVPVYPHQVAQDDGAPQAAAMRGRAPQDWPAVAPASFRFSLHRHSLVEATTRGRAPVLGYFKGFDICSLSIRIVPAACHSLASPGESLGTATLLSLRKFRVGRLGELSEIRKEVRTWHGRPFTDDMGQ